DRQCNLAQRPHSRIDTAEACLAEATTTPVAHGSFHSIRTSNDQRRTPRAPFQACTSQSVQDERCRRCFQRGHHTSAREALLLQPDRIGLGSIEVVCSDKTILTSG
ncbi:unnamed protein product, partial [Didymodactylos carnosus]